MAKENTNADKVDKTDWQRVVRGGSFHDGKDLKNPPISYRDIYDMDNEHDLIGFRLVLQTKGKK